MDSAQNRSNQTDMDESQSRITSSAIKDPFLLAAALWSAGEAWQAAQQAKANGKSFP